MESVKRVLGFLLAVFAIISGGYALWTIPLNPVGFATVTVPLHALLGVGAGIALILNWQHWRTVMLIWVIFLIPAVAVDPSGLLTRSLIFLGFTSSSSTSSETLSPFGSAGKVVTYSAWGINFIGLVLFAWLLLAWDGIVVRLPGDPSPAVQQRAVLRAARRRGIVIFSIALLGTALATLLFWIDYSNKVNSAEASSHFTRGNAHLEKKEYDEAIKEYDEAVRLKPKHATVFNNRALAWVWKKEYDKAFKDFDEAIRLDPKDATAFANRASAWADQKEYDNAIKDYDEAIRLESWGHLFVERGSVWVHKKEYGKAIEDYDAAIVSAPEDPVTAWAYNRKAWLLATCPIEEYRDGKQAVELAKKACGLVGWKGASYFESLAAAFAENGHFDEAVKWQNKALDDAEHFKKENGEKGQQRVKMYEGKTPYRDQGD